ncbi:hypothetical protein OEZ85_008738 [Tetradesmus obliquus]|uniref:Tubby C-terminal domain-containing protein n=1 Tax=Tetradesmus obliquus TaxID=3088 RepID=A0ABY8TNF1_TETOB|nr:hypothetical protein OEZ85_008738 [Tetradesmus obliquus]
MVKTYRTLLADGTITASGRPQSGNSRNRIETGAAAAAVKVYSNNLFDGDILSAEAAAAPYAAPQPPSPSKIPSVSSQKFQQQRAMAAQKRLERLQLGGVAQNNDGAVAIVQISSSMPNTPGSTRAAGLAAAAVSSGFASPTAAQAAAGSGSFGRAVSGSSNSSMAETSLTSSQPRPWSGSGLRPSSAAERNLVAKGLATVYDPSEDAEASAGCSSRAAETAGQEIEVVRPGGISAGNSTKLLQQGVPRAALDLSDMAAFLTRPGPKTGALLCFIERDKGGMGQSPCYRMHMDDGRTFLLAARKRKKATSSHYVISSSPQDLSRGSSSYFGKLKANFVGTEFSIQCKSSVLASTAAKGSLAVSSSAHSPAKRLSSGNGRDGRQTRDSMGSEGGAGAAAELLMQEVGAVTFGYNVLGTRGPRRMNVAVPAVHSADGSHRWRATGPDDTLAERIKNGTTGEQVTVLHNKSPKWNDALNAYCLNFGGRVTEASVKNFQLVTEAEPDAVVLQFGKVSDSCFTCDFMWPLSPLQAFCICLASFDNKLACE